jgi:energy-coupling factor transporter transmembrane protein EcfT
MALRISIGQYYPADSPIHRLDPRTKVLCGVTIMVLTFFVRTPLQLAYGLAFIVALTAATRVPAGKVLASVRPLLAILVLLSLFNLFLVRGGETLWSLGILSVTTASLWAAVLYSLRVVIAILAGVLLLLTTTPTELTDAFDAGLAPLAKVGLPAHELAMVFSLMLRFIPTLADELSAILDAQRSRGGSFAEGSLARRVRSLVPVLVALLASSLRHANDLSRTLDARCFEGGASRTHWHPLRLERRDAIAAVACLLFAAGLFSLGALAPFAP